MEAALKLNALDLFPVGVGGFGLKEVVGLFGADVTIGLDPN